MGRWVQPLHACLDIVLLAALIGQISSIAIMDVRDNAIIYRDLIT